MRAIFSAFIAGEIFFLSLSKIPTNTIIYCLLLAILGNIFLIKFVSRLDGLRFFNLPSTLIFGASLTLMLGFGWSFYLSLDRTQNILSKELEGVSLVIDGVIDGLPQDSAEGRRFTLKVLRWKRASIPINKEKGQEIDWNEAKDGFPQRVSLGWYAPREFFNQSTAKSVDLSGIPEIIPGQRWQLPVKLKQPRGLLNPHAFDYELWMFMQNLGANGNVQVKRNNSESYHPHKLSDFTFDFQAMVERLRYELRRKILSAFTHQEKYAGVIVALVIGDQNAIDQNDWKIFNTTGIGHLISISGLHVTMLAGFGAYIAQRLWRRRDWPLLIPAQKVGVLFGFITAVIYSLLAGFQIPAQRTMFMMGILAVSMWAGRVMRPFDVWWWALLFVMFLNPWAIFTPGFWLSFGAVALILYAMPPSSGINQAVETDVDWVFIQKFKESLGQACRVQLVVTIGLIPITLWWFSQISLISPIANSFAIPIISFVVTPIAMIGAFLPSFIGDLFLWVSHWVLEMMIYPLKVMSEWSWALAFGAKPSWWAMLLALLGVFWVVAPGPLSHQLYLRFIGLGLCLSIFISGYSRFADRVAYGDFRALVWDIGQGTAVLIKTQNHYLLYDAGPISNQHNDPGLRIILPYLRAEGVAQIDQLAISHKDSDHIGGVESIVTTIPVKNVIGSVPGSHRLMDVFHRNAVPVEPCQAGGRWEWDGVEFIVWHPSPTASFEDWFHRGRPNEISCVIEVRNQHFSFWLTGDIEKIGESEIVSRLDQFPNEKEALKSRVKVLMAPHHGSKTSSSPIFLNSIEPDWAFSQSGYKNRYNHPHPTISLRYQDFGLNLLDTSLTGAQVWNFEQKKLNLEQFRNSVRRFWHR